MKTVKHLPSAGPASRAPNPEPVKLYRVQITLRSDPASFLLSHRTSARLREVYGQLRPLFNELGARIRVAVVLDEKATAEAAKSSAWFKVIKEGRAA